MGVRGKFGTQPLLFRLNRPRCCDASTSRGASNRCEHRRCRPVRWWSSDIQSTVRSAWVAVRVTPHLSVLRHVEADGWRNAWLTAEGGSVLVLNLVVILQVWISYHYPFLSQAAMGCLRVAASYIALTALFVVGDLSCGFAEAIAKYWNVAFAAIPAAISRNVTRIRP